MQKFTQENLLICWNFSLERVRLEVKLNSPDSLSRYLRILNHSRSKRKSHQNQRNRWSMNATYQKKIMQKVAKKPPRQHRQGFALPCPRGVTADHRIWTICRISFFKMNSKFHTFSFSIDTKFCPLKWRSDFIL